jgi:inosine/xanthosine triphosphate pyrophosphatase family protein
MELWVGSTNPAKLRQLAAALGTAGVQVRGVSDPAVLPQVDEDCADALGNARKKAIAFAAALGRPCLAMDASLLLPDLSPADQPGVHVRRLPGAAHRPGDDEVLAHYTLLCEQNGGRLRARWVYGLAIGLPDGRSLDGTAVAERMLVAPPCAARQPGYPLDSLQQEPATGKYLAELSQDAAAAHQAQTIGAPLRELAARAAALADWAGARCSGRG